MINFKNKLQTLAVSYILASSIIGTNTFAAEGGGSCYLQGTYNDFATAVLGPKGFYFRNDLLYYTANVGIHAMGGQIAGAADQKVWVNTLKAAYISDLKVLGGTYSTAIVVPIALNIRATGSANIAGNDLSGGTTSGGIGDIYLIPFKLGWTIKNHHISAAAGLYMPAGSYDVNKKINVGRNYWAFDPCVSYTYLDPKRGHDISLTTGMLFNGKNTATNYTTGTEFHLDWNIAQYLSKSFGLGFTGYWYQQLSADKGSLPAGYETSNFKAHSLGLGAAAFTSFKIGQKDINVIGKWIGDVSAKNRFKGNLFMLSFALKI